MKDMRSETQIPEDYPFMFRNFEEAYANLLYIYDNYDEALKKIQPLKEKVKEFDMQVTYDKIRNIGIGLVDEHKVKVTSGIKSLAEEAIKSLGKDMFTLTEFLHEMSLKGRNFPELPNVRGRTYRFPTDYDIYRYLVSLGYKYEFQFNEGYLDEVIFYENKS